jgi:hypothetical protein
MRLVGVFFRLLGSEVAASVIGSSVGFAVSPQLGERFQVLVG